MTKVRFRPCIIIPVYNHEHIIASMIERLHAMSLFCIVINDGSNKSCSETLSKIASSMSNVILRSFDNNQGKGQAVIEGMNIAYKEGWTHALQIDADGQFSLDQIDKFISIASIHRGDVVAGHRSYKDMSFGRRYGRLITDTLVALYTFSFNIKDPMCGYRLYPIKDTIALIKSIDIGKRMDFDTDIIVRLYWKGLSIKHVPVPVVYSKSIHSNFRYFSDNIRMVWMHLGLLKSTLMHLFIKLTK